MKALTNRLPTIILVGSILIILLFRIHLSFVRYFDNDELSHLHWAYLIAIGKIPYRDFFFYISHFFQLALLPLMWIPTSAVTLVLARVYQLVLFLTTAGLLSLLAYRITKNQVTMLLSLLVYLSFPMTIDKTIDVRPDTIMIVLFLAAILIFTSSKVKATLRFLLSGLLISCALILLPKIVFTLPSLLFLGVVNRKSITLTSLLQLIIGGAIPALLFFLYLTWHGILPDAITSMTRDAIAVNAGKIPFSALRTLSPWPLVYMDRGGISWPWVVNTAIWVIAALGLAITVIKIPKWGVFFLLFFSSAIIYIIIFPVPYVQYFMPLSVFASLLAAYTFSLITRFLTRVLPFTDYHVPIALIVSIACLTSFYQQYAVRIVSTNEEQLGVIRDVLAISKPNETFYDMVGSYIFRPDGYYICCHPFGEFQGKLSTSVPTLSLSLVKNNTKFTVMDRTAIAFWQTPEPDLTFLKSNYYTSAYKKIYTLGYQYRCTNGICSQYDFGDIILPTQANRLTIVIEEKYMILTEPPGSTITLNGEQFTDSQVVLLKPAVYAIGTDTQTASVRIQLSR